jgi:hypothetical protein
MGVMLVQSGHYRIDRSKILFEQFEDETVLINTETGYYYSLSQEGSEILRLLDEGCPVEEVLFVLFGNPVHPLPVSDEIWSFLASLRDEGIVTSSAAVRSDSLAVIADKSRYADSATYKAPLLERFDDVRELLLIDPVHQVDEEYGWPKAINAIDEAGNSKG